MNAHIRIAFMILPLVFVLLITITAYFMSVTYFANGWSISLRLGQIQFGSWIPTATIPWLMAPGGLVWNEHWDYPTELNFRTLLLPSSGRTPGGAASVVCIPVWPVIPLLIAYAIVSTRSLSKRMRNRRDVN